MLARIGGFEVEMGKGLGAGGRTTRHYYLDAHIGWRLMLFGYKAMLVPDARVFHKYVVKPMTPRRYQDYEVMRVSFLLSSLMASTILILLPTFLIGEVIALGLALSFGPRTVFAKLGSYPIVWSERKEISARRTLMRELRRTSDSAIIRGMDRRMEVTHQLGHPVARIVNYLVNLSLWGLHWISFGAVWIKDQLLHSNLPGTPGSLPKE